MKFPAISLWQPWASLIFPAPAGPPPKIHETRDWPAPRRLIGRRVAIHAAKKRVKLDDLNLEVLCRRHLPAPPPLGAVIGLVTLADCYLADLVRATRATPTDVLSGDWTPGRWLWRLADPVAIAPIPTIGRQGWFEVDLPEGLDHG